MSKPKPIKLTDKHYFAWEYEEQTKIKHKVLGAYSKVWIAKLGKYNDTMFFDCHAGCGAYIDLISKEVSYGSSFIVEDVADKLNKNRQHKNYICACEIDKSSYDNYKQVASDIGKNTISLKNQDFHIVLDDSKVKRYYSSHPTLFFVDPFGYTMKMSAIEKMMVNSKNEVFINFMFDYLNRFLAVSDGNLLDDFFGTHDWANANNLTGVSREQFLIELYRNQVKKATGAKYVFSYKISYPDRDKTYYYLVHATNHIDGITHMKEAFASVNNGRVQYLGKNNNGISFFDFSFLKADEIYKSCLLPLKGQSITFIELWESIVEATAYTSKDLSEALAELVKSGKIEVERVTSKRCSYKENDIIKII